MGIGNVVKGVEQVEKGAVHVEQVEKGVEHVENVFKMV